MFLAEFVGSGSQPFPCLGRNTVLINVIIKKKSAKSVLIDIFCVWNIGYPGDRLLQSLQRRWTREVVDMGRFQ